MGFVYSEFDTTPNTLVADLKAKILLSSDYSNPTGQVVMATTPLGAKIVMDLSGAGGGVAPGLQGWGPTFWRNWSAGVGTDAMTAGRQLWYKSLATGAVMTMPLHCRVSAGPTLLYVDVEGPRAGETAPDHVTTGSFRQMLALAELTPYHAADLVPAVVLCGSASYPGYSTFAANSISTWSHASRNAANTLSWPPGILTTLVQPNSQAVSQLYNWNPLAMDGKTYLAPYVWFEHVAGIRGRLTDIFYSGQYMASTYNGNDTVITLNPGDVVTYGGNSYKILAPFKGSIQTNGPNGGSLGMTPQNSSVPLSSILAAVRVA